MEFICQHDGKVALDHGRRFEGALTKGPFNALPPIIDLNNALVSWVLTGFDGFVTAAGYVGPQARWTMISACWSLKFGAACRRRNATRGS